MYTLVQYAAVLFFVLSCCILKMPFLLRGNLMEEQKRELRLLLSHTYYTLLLTSDSVSSLDLHNFGQASASLLFLVSSLPLSCASMPTPSLP